MVLPFVRDLFADAEKLPAFSRVTTHLRANAGRIRVTGLNSPAKCLLIAQLQKTATRPLIVLVRNNEAADALLPGIQAYCEFVAGVSAHTRLSFAACSALPSP